MGIDSDGILVHEWLGISNPSQNMDTIKTTFKPETEEEK